MLLKLHPRFAIQLDKEENRLNKVRIRILSTLLIAYIGIFSSLIFIYLYEGLSFLMARVVIITIILSTTLAAMINGVRWRIIAHIFLCCLCLVIWTNMLYIHEGINLVNMQYIALIMACSFYLLEAKWGFIYACGSSVPLLLYVFFTTYGNLEVGKPLLSLNTKAYNLILSLNAAILLYVHYYFFKKYKEIHSVEIIQQDHLKRALDAAEETANEKTNFLATMSHELRTPLNAVIGMTHLLRMEEHLEGQKDNLDVLQFSADNLMTIINDILDFNKINAGKVEITNTDFRLDVMLKQLCGTFKDKAAAKGLKFDCRSSIDLDGVTLSGDQTRLSQILFNLIGNAVKFTLTGGISINVHTTFEGTTDFKVRFEISDTGIGIPKEQLTTIFEPYSQSKLRTNKQYHGTGLGLTIAKRLVTLLGGELRIQSEEGNGTIFDFELPLRFVSKRLDTVVKSPVRSQRDLKHLKVLVAEDNQVNILVIKKLLKKWDIIPTIVENGQLAVEAMQNDSFDVVLMDINMPVMDGFEASRLIREMPNKQRATVPIIALTASIGAAIEHHHGYQYLTDCILKPFKPEELLSKLEKI